MAASRDFKISGYVKDTAGRPVPYAHISAVGTDFAVLCNDNGAYSLTLPQGNYSLEAYMIGYERVEKSVTLSSNTQCNFTIADDALSLSEVSVIGKSENRKLKESFFSVNALDIKSLAGSIVSLDDVVGRSSGVKIRKQGGEGSDFDLSINGLSGNSIRYFIDGVPLDSKGSNLHIDNIPVSSVNRIEVYKGVVPSYLGSDALGGAVNIVTNQAQRNFLDVSVGAGSFHTYNADLNARFTLPGTAVQIRPTVGYNYSKNDYMMKDVEIWDETSRKYIHTDKRRFHDDYMSLFAQLEGGVNNVSWADAFFIGASYTKLHKELQTGAMQNKVYGLAEKRSNAWNLFGRYNKRFDILYTHLNFSHTWDHSETVDSAKRKYDWAGDWLPSSGNEINGRAPSIRIYKRPMTVLNVGADFDFNIHHTISVNYMLNRTGNKRSDEFDRTFSPTNDVLYKHITSLTYTQHFFNGRLNNIFFGKSYVNTTRIRQNELPTLSGYNLIVPDSRKAYWGGGAGFNFRIWDYLQFKASYEHSVRLPLAHELLGNGTTIDTNLALKPENSENGNVSVFGTWCMNGDNVIAYEINGFIRHVNDYIRMSVSERDGLMKYENVPAVEVKGVDVDINYQWRNNLEVSFNCSYNDSRNLKKYKEDGNPNATYKNRVPNKPWVFSNAGAAYSFYGLLDKSSRLRLSYDFSYIHWFYLNWEAFGSKKTKARIPTQNISNISLSYTWHDGRYTFTASCDNIFNKTAYDNYMLQKPGRAFYAKFRFYLTKTK